MSSHFARRAPAWAPSAFSVLTCLSPLVVATAVRAQAASAAPAAPSATAAPANLQPVVVTPSRSEQALPEVLAPVTLISREDLRDIIADEGACICDRCGHDAAHHPLA